ncbi:MAG: hypothetical protein P8045_08350, partial [Candidatus Thiodiazotropha sp.]
FSFASFKFGIFFENDAAMAAGREIIGFLTALGAYHYAYCSLSMALTLCTGVRRHDVTLSESQSMSGL